MRKSDLTFSFLLIPVDFLMIFLAGFAAHFLRFQALVELRPVFYQISIGRYLGWVAIVSLVWLVVFALAGLYTIQPTRKWMDEITKVFFACTAGVMIIIIAIFLQRELFSSRFIILAGWILAIIFVGFGRSVVRYIRHLLFKKGIGVHRIILIGSDKITEEIARTLYKHPKFGYKIIERIKNFEEIIPARLKELNEKYLRGIDEIIQADPNIPKEKNLELLDFCNEYHIIFKYAADLFEAQATNIKVDTISGIPVVEIKRTSLDGWGKIIKRIIDIVGSILGLIILSPLFLIVAVIIKLDSAGPAFVGLKRVGEKNKLFELYKFRSMIKNAEALKKDLLQYSEREGPLFKMKEDPRITRFGKFIRKISIDELPQLWNVLKGDMSLVGPRPHEPREVEQYEKHHKQLLSIKPGITGMAQVSGRAELEFEEEVKLDTYYIENWSPKLDLQILLKTPFVVLSKKGAK